MDDSDEEYIAPSRGTDDRAGSGGVDMDIDSIGTGSASASASASVPPTGGDDVDGDNDDVRGVARRTRGKKPQGGTIQDMKGENGGYSWEDAIQRPWDMVNNGDDESGRSLDIIVQQMIENRKKKMIKNSATPFQRGIIRTVILVIDGSLTMLEKDLRPTRFSMMLSLLSEYIMEFFDQNPISQLGIVMMRNGISYLVSEVSGSPQSHIEKIREIRARQHNRYEPKGDPSLQNALEMSRSLLKVSFGNNNNNRNSKEILVILGALFTSDPGDIHKTIDSLVKENIKARVIGLSAQVAICQELVNRTNHFTKQTPSGKKIIPVNASNNNYGIIMNESHFRELLMECVIPLPVPEDDVVEESDDSQVVPLIRVGFPLKLKPVPVSMGLPQLIANSQQDEMAGILDGGDSENKGNNINGTDTNNNGNNNTNNVNGVAQTVAYECPQCGNKVCHLPTVCPVCDLMLILSTHLARSYHHLVPLLDFKEVPVSETYSYSHCYGCLLQFPEGTKMQKEGLGQYTSSRFRCPKCSSDFCIDCDVFVHETLHNCPGCENKPKK